MRINGTVSVLYMVYKMCPSIKVGLCRERRAKRGSTRLTYMLIQAHHRKLTLRLTSDSHNCLLYLLSKFRLIVALLSPSSFLAVTLYFPASSMVTFFISSDAEYECPSLSTLVWKNRYVKLFWKHFWRTHTIVCTVMTN